jgi:endonuclease/exonuclease/phosphatase family metal-dependent hydrolase
MRVSFPIPFLCEFAVWKWARLASVCLSIGAFDLHAQVTVRVLDFNIHRDLGGTDSDTAAQPALARIVNYLDPDVWTINELGGRSTSFKATVAHDDLVNFIEQDLTIFGANPQEGADFFVYIGTIIDGFITNAIVSRFPLLATQTFSDAGDGFAALRGLTMGFVDLPGANDLGVFTAHFKAFNSTTDAERRQAEADTDSSNVRNWINTHPSAGAVVAGDFNETEDSGQPANWSGHAIGDLLPNSGEPYHPITTMKSPGLIDAMPVSIRGDKDTIDAAGPTPTTRFDYMLFAPENLTLSSGMIFDTKQYTSVQLAALNAANGTSFLAADSATASDHLPLLAVFQVIPEPLTIALFGCALISFWPSRRPRASVTSMAFPRRDD